MEISMKPFDRLVMIMTKPWVVGCYLGFLVLLFLYLDKPIAIFFHDLNLRNFFKVQRGKGLK